MNVPLYVAIMAILVLLSAYFSATETAFASMSKPRMKVLAETNKKAALALKLSDNYDKLISTILIGNNIVNIALSSLGTIMFIFLIGDIGATVSTAVVTVVVLIFGEICPKGIAKETPERFAIFSAPIIGFLMIILTPFSAFFSLIKNGVSKLFGSKNKEAMSQEELLIIVDEAKKDGGINEEEHQLLNNAIEFSDLSAEDILTHRTDLEAVSINADKKDIAHVFSETKFSRLLVYEDTIDNIIGVIHQKDFYSETTVTEKSIKDIMTPPIFTIKTEKIDDLLRLLQKNKSHIAIVLDEYGGTYGMITMEDILEELVGEIWDEHDEVTEALKEVSENIFHVDGLMNFDDFCDQFEIKHAEAESVSVGGWVSEKLEKIAEKGDSFTFEKLNITVSEIDGHRVATLEIEVLDEIPEENKEATDITVVEE